MKVTIDVISEDPTNKEWALYLVEEGPWNGEELEGRLKTLQERIYNAVDVAIDGHLASKFPDSMGRAVRIQVDCYDDPPEDVEAIVREIAETIEGDAEYQRAIRDSKFITGMRIVTMSEVGRRGGAK
jgi:hypothetical protein